MTAKDSSQFIKLCGRRDASEFLEDCLFDGIRKGNLLLHELVCQEGRSQAADNLSLSIADGELIKVMLLHFNDGIVSRHFSRQEGGFLKLEVLDSVLLPPILIGY